MFFVPGIGALAGAGEAHGSAFALADFRDAGCTQVTALTREALPSGVK